MDTQTILTDENLADYLAQLGLFPHGAALELSPAGDGNINWVQRVQGEDRSFIVKQARPALEKFPEYEAPTERIACEAGWLERARAHDADGLCPEVLHFDLENRVLVLEDLSESERMDDALARGATLGEAPLRIARLLGRLHAATRLEPASELANAFANDGMRQLHGEHIFVLPFTPNDFPMPPETRAAAERIQQDGTLGETAARAYERYLRPEGALVHGDVQAGNVLLVDGRPKLLDAEIAHLGDPAFDVGTLLAHLVLHDVAREPARRDRRDDRHRLVRIRGSPRRGRTGRAHRRDPLRRPRANPPHDRRCAGSGRRTGRAGLRVLACGEAWALSPEGISG